MSDVKQKRSDSPSARAEVRVIPALLGIILFLAAGLRFLGLGSKPLWTGEVQELVAARSDRWLAQILDSATDVIGYTWHHLVWLAGLPPGETATRLLAALAGTATIPVIYRLGSRLRSRTAGLAAAILLTFSFFHVYHSQDARAVVYLAFFYSLSWLAMLEIFIHGNRRWIPVFILAAGGAALSHSLGGIYLALQGLTFLGLAFWSFGPEEADVSSLSHVERIKRYLGPALASLPICAFQLYVVTEYAYAFSVTRNPVTHSAEIQDLFLLNLFHVHLTGGVALTRILLSLAFVCGLVALAWRRQWRAVVVGVWLFIPAAFLYLIMTASGLARFETYHLLPCLVPFLLVAGIGVAAAVSLLMGRWAPDQHRLSRLIGTVALTLLLALAANGRELVRYHESPIRLYQGHDYRSLAGWFDQHPPGPDDLVYANYAESMMALNFYAGDHLKRTNVLTPWRPPDETWRYHLLTRASFQSTESDVARLVPNELLTRGRLRQAHPEGLQGSIYLLLVAPPSPENKGYGDYHRWLTGGPLFTGESDLNALPPPPGFEAIRFPGVVLFKGEARGPALYDQLELLRPYLIRNAPPLLRDMGPEVYGRSYYMGR